MIDEEWTILSFSAKWLDRKDVIYMDTGGRGVGKVRDDHELLQALWAVLDNADVVVTQNGNSFDIKKINARLIMSGFKPYSPIRLVDTKLVAQKHFAFTSNKLAWMSDKLTPTKKQSHRKFPGFELWAECLKDNPKAWAEMKKYNVADTVATEELYLEMLPWIGGHPNLAAYVESDAPACPKCTSTKLQRRGSSRTQTGEYARYQCQECGGWARGRENLTSKEKRSSLLSS